MPQNRLAHQVVADRYELLDTVGRGGFGVVWRASDTLLQRHVAVKEIHIPGYLGEEDRAKLREKVLREARAAARLDHPGAVTVFDVIDDAGHPVIVMELVEAPNLAELVARRGPLEPAEAARIGLEVLDVLIAAHERGIVHRDVKPANVMVGDSGRVRLGDFGVAAILDDPTVTSSGSVTGSPAYMAPEQATNKGAVPESDLWSLGATLYFAVEGRPPFDKGAPVPTLTAIVQEPPRPATEAGPLGPVLDGLLVKDPKDRMTATHLRDRLARVAAAESPAPTVATRNDVTDVISREQLEQVAAPSPPPPPAPSHPGVTPPVVRPPERRAGNGGRSPALVIGLVGAVVAALVAVALLAGRSPDPAPDTASPSASATPSTTAAAARNGAGTPSTAAAPARSASTADWVPYSDPQTGFTISRPPNWTIRTDGTLTDFRDPETGAYLRVDHVQPPGPSPEGAWETLEETFAAENANYRRNRIEPTTYGSYRAAIWEFTYTAGQADLRVANLGFVTPDYGFALYFQTRAGDWDRMQPILQAFKEAFRAPA